MMLSPAFVTVVVCEARLDEICVMKSCRTYDKLLYR